MWFLVRELLKVFLDFGILFDQSRDYEFRRQKTSLWNHTELVVSLRKSSILILIFSMCQMGKRKKNAVEEDLTVNFWWLDCDKLFKNSHPDLWKERANQTDREGSCVCTKKATGCSRFSRSGEVERVRMSNSRAQTSRRSRSQDFFSPTRVNW